MNLNPDDPRLTAYALGELPENERAALEAELQQSPEARAAVEEIRQAAKLLANELAAEPAPRLSPAQRETIEEQLQSAKVVPFPGRKAFTATALFAAAACLVFALASGLWLRPAQQGPKQMVSVQPDRSPPQGQPTVPPAVAPPVVDDKSRQAAANGPSPVTVQNSLLMELDSHATPPPSVPAPVQPPTSVQVPTPSSPPPATIAGGDKLAWSGTAAPASDGSRRTDSVSPAYRFQTKLEDANSTSVKIGGYVDGSASQTPGTLNKLSTQTAQTSAGSDQKPKLDNWVQSPPTPPAQWGSFDGTTQNPVIVPSGDIKRLQQTITVTAGTANTTPNGSGAFGGGGGGAGGRGRATTQLGVNRTVEVEMAWSERSKETVYSANAVGFYDDTYNDKKDSQSLLGDQPITGRMFRSEARATDTARYPQLVENSFRTPLQAPLSTFSIDVDTASYANTRRFLNEGRMPPRDAVRVEEMINYFTYRYPQPKGDDLFAASIEVAGCPWDTGHRLVRVGLKGREMAQDKRPPSNFVFLIDVSGSMKPRERLPLIKEALRELVKKMKETDRVAIVVYASQAGIRLPSTSCAEKEKILQAIDELDAGGSTNGGDGIQQAYQVAEKNFISEGVNRVLLCTDGDFNVGITDQGQLVHMIQEKAKSGVFLTTLGVGTDNFKDALMQKLADKGNGNYHYLDTLEEAHKVLIEQMNGTLVTIAKDVKIQIEFNPTQVGAYRLIGYEKRLLRKEDFNNDAKDAGEIGAGHTVTALYEIVPAGREVPGAVDDLKYQPTGEVKPERYVKSGSRELLTLKIRYKQPDGDRSRLLEFPVTDAGQRFANASTDFKFAAAVASFGMLLRESEYKGESSFGAVLEWAEEAKGPDEEGYRSEFLNLVRKARSLK